MFEPSTERTLLLSVNTEEGKPVPIEPIPRFYLPRRYIMKFMCGGAAMVCYIMRVNLAIAINSMSKELHWDSKMQGDLMASFFVGYVSTQFIGGYLAPRLGCKIMLGFAVLCPALLTLATPFCVHNWPLLLLIRLCTGVGEGVMYPSFYEVSSRWWPIKEQATAWSYVSIGAASGTVIAYVSGAPEIALLGWPGAFYVSGALGLLWFMFWIVLAADTPLQSRIIHPAETAYICTNLEVKIRDSIALRKSPTWYVVKRLLGSVAVWASLFHLVLSGWGFYVLLFYLPTYFSEVLHFNNTESFLASVMNPLTSVFTIFIGGRILKSMMLRGVDTTIAVKLMLTTAMILSSIPVVVAMYVPMPPVASAFVLAIGVGFNGIGSPALLTLNSLIAPSHASVFVGITNTAANIPGIVGLYTTGAVLETVGSWKVVFMLPVVCSTISIIQFLILGSAKKVI